MTQNKRFSALLLALAILLTLAPQVYFLIRADADTTYTYDTYSGECGDGLHWRFYHAEYNYEAETLWGCKNNTLKITGTGDMWDNYDFMVTGTTYYSSISDTIVYPFNRRLNGDVAELNLSESMTGIGAKAFYEFGIKEAEIPKSVKRIGESAFEGCSRLESVTINNASCEIFDSVQTLGGYPDKTTIRGYTGSTAETYANKYGYAFESLGIGNPFEDVKDTDYFYQAVLWAVGQGVTTGTSDTTFSPKNDCTRGQVVTFLWRANGQPEPKSTAHSFVDIDSNAYYYKAVLWAVENEITNGMDATHFMPKNTCTRGQVVTFLYRAKDIPAAAEKPLTATAAADKTTLPDGESATLSVTVKNGKAPFEYLWQSYSKERGTWLTTMQTGTGYTTNKAGEYRCQVTDANGTVVYSNTVVIQWAEGTEELKASISASKTSIASGETTTMSVTVTGGLKPYRYQWMKADTTFGIVTISGATESSYVAESPGTYACFIYDGHNQSVNVWIEIGSK